MMPNFKVSTNDSYLAVGTPEATEHSLAICLQAYNATVTLMPTAEPPVVVQMHDIIDGQDVTIHQMRAELRDLKTKNLQILGMVRDFIDEGGADEDCDFVKSMVALGMEPFEREVTGAVTVSYTVEYTISDVPASISDEQIRQELCRTLSDNVETGGCNFYISPCSDINEQLHVEFDSACDPSIDSFDVNS